MFGRGPAVIQQVPGGAAPSQPPGTGVGIPQVAGTPSKRACWSICTTGVRVTRPPVACPPDYALTADGQCCLRSQMTDSGICCPAGQRPDARRQACVPVSPPLVTVPRRVTPEVERHREREPEVRHPCPSGQHWDERRNRCVPTPTVHECPSGRHWDDRRHRCVPDVERHECPAGQHWNGRRCVGERHPRENHKSRENHRRELRSHDKQRDRSSERRHPRSHD